MDIWQKPKSPLGYHSNDNEIDSYGVNHSGFSTSDEVHYQVARIRCENELIEQLKKQGVTNLPQYGTNFWGNPENNYGFGTSHIEENLEKRKQAAAQNNYAPTRNEPYIFSPKMRNELGMLESSDNYTKLTEKGGGIGALGRYQLRGPGLQDIGYVKKDENKNYHWLGKTTFIR